MSDVGGVLIFGEPELPRTASSDARYQQAEFESLLLAICAMGAPALATRWPLLLAGLSDGEQPWDTLGSTSIVPAAIGARLRTAGARAAVIHNYGVAYRRDDGRICDFEVPRGIELPCIPISLTLDPIAATFTPVAGILPLWAAACGRWLQQLVQYPARVSVPSRDAPQRDGRTQDRDDDLLVVVAYRGDSVARHLLHCARNHRRRTRFIDLRRLIGDAVPREEFERDLLRIVSATRVYSRPLDANSGETSVAGARRRGEVLRALEARASETMNLPSAGWSNLAKIVQVSQLRAFGLATPRSLVTNDPAAAMRFIQDERMAIYKSCSSNRSIVVAWRDQDLRRLELLPACPVLFQSHLVGVDCRLHFVREKPFATMIRAAGVDYRYSTERVKYERGAPPPRVVADALDASLSMHLLLSGVDLKYDERSEAWFALEVNRSPAFSLYDHAMDGQIARAILGA